LTIANQYRNNSYTVIVLTVLFYYTFCYFAFVVSHACMPIRRPKAYISGAPRQADAMHTFASTIFGE